MSFGSRSDGIAKVICFWIFIGKIRDIISSAKNRVLIFCEKRKLYLRALDIPICEAKDKMAQLQGILIRKYKKNTSEKSIHQALITNYNRLLESPIHQARNTIQVY